MPAQYSFQRTTDWGVGFVGQISFTPDTALSGWTLAFDAAFSIDSMWGAEIVAREGSRYLIRATGWNGTVAPGATVTFGLSASGTSAEVVPLGWALAGPEVTSLTPPPPPPPPVPTTPPVISVSDTVAVEDDGFAVFTVTLSHASSGTVSVGYGTRNGSAKAGADFTATVGTVTFAAGETVKQVRIALTDDTTIEANETFRLQLAAAKGGTLGDSEGIARVSDDDAPRISVSDASVLEGVSGRVSLVYTVSLSHAANATVSVGFATANGTASALDDYIARSGTLTFAVGETQKTVTVSVRGDKAVEADETVHLLLTAPVRGVIEDGTGVGTIRNDDLPKITIADAVAVREGAVSTGHAMVGALSTRGGDIIDASGTAVKIAAVNWFGMEDGGFAPHGLNVRNWQDMMDQMQEVGFNAIRLPFSAQAVLDGGTLTGINFALNPDLAGLTPLRMMDKIVGYAGDIGLRIILDHHRSGAGAGPNGNGLWHDGAYTEARWIEMWETLAERYAGNPTVIGADLSNEPHSATWDAWATAAERAGNAALAVNPDWLIFVEGVAQHDGQYYWWGGNLMGAEDRPVELDVANKLVYSAHDYPNSVWAQPFFSSPDFADHLPALFDQMWGHLWRQGDAPVFIGEFGTKLTDPKDVAWLEKLVAYMSGDVDADGDKDVAGPGVSYAYWSWNPDSGDTGGILADDWTTVLSNKIAAIDAILPDSAPALAQASFEVKLSQAFDKAVSVKWHTVAGTASEADYVKANGTLVFNPGETSRTIAIAILGDEATELAERFNVVLSDAVNASIADGTGIGVINDWIL